MGIISPVKSSAKLISMPHWQRVWLDNHSSINCSGLIQELLTEVIRHNDPVYFEKYKKYVESPLIRKKEIIDRLVETIPTIY